MNEVILPTGWMSTALENVCEVVAGNPAPQGEVYFENGEFNFVRVQDMGRQGDATYLSETKDRVNEHVISKLRLFPKGSVLFTKSGASTLNNQRAILGIDSYVVSHIAAAIPENGILSEWIYFSLVCVDFADLAHSSVMPSLPLSKVKPIQIFVPPTNEQHRIVAKIEELFSDLDKGIENLKTARAQLKVYRQALLKHAFEGKLTAQWREQSRDKLETAEALQKRIQQERAQRYQQQLANWQTNGGSKPKAPKSLPPLTAEELAEFPELPEGWGWVKVDSYCDTERNSIKAGPFGSSLKKEFYVKEGYKVYGQEQVISGDWKYGDYFIDEARYHDLESCKVKPFDILISLVGTLGKVLVLPENITPGVINPRLVKISPNLNTVVPEFFKYYFESSFLKGLYKLKTHGATMDVLNLGIIQELPFPICSLKEQKFLIQEIEARLSEVDQLDQTITTSLQQAEALRQSILKKAFSGQLVPQDPHDEPASALLARIRAERTDVVAKPRKVAEEKA